MTLVLTVAATAAGAAAGYALGKGSTRSAAEALRARVRSLEEELARRDAASNASKAEVRAEVRAELSERDERAARREASLAGNEESLARREGDVAKREHELLERERTLTKREAAVGELEAAKKLLVAQQGEREREALVRVSRLSAEDAKRQLLDGFLEQARADAAKEARQIEELAREEAEKRAKRIVGIALQRYAGDFAGERAVTTVHLPSDELKGRIIGREGRNIRAFQEATGCDLVVDDTPETIVVSAFDPVKREVARLALERLIADGRIHPTKIEECVAKAREEVERTVREAAEGAALELNVGRLHPELAKLVGSLRYRYSYAQNVLRHSVEVGYLAGLMASELKLDARVARRAGFLHDIGKAVTHEVEGGHAVIGGQYARKYGEDERVANAIAAHHEDEPARDVLAHLVMAADAVSGARPGARREMLESYVNRLEDLEKICGSFAGVEKSYAIQAGREVRVFVEPGSVDDAAAAMLSRDIARRIESELAYPGQIRVTVVRETRAVDYAR